MSLQKPGSPTAAAAPFSRRKETGQKASVPLTPILKRLSASCLAAAAKI